MESHFGKSVCQIAQLLNSSYQFHPHNLKFTYTKTILNQCMLQKSYVLALKLIPVSPICISNFSNFLCLHFVGFSNFRDNTFRYWLVILIVENCSSFTPFFPADLDSMVCGNNIVLYILTMISSTMLGLTIIQQTGFFAHVTRYPTRASSDSCIRVI